MSSLHEKAAAGDLEGLKDELMSWEDDEKADRINARLAHLRIPTSVFRQVSGENRDDVQGPSRIHSLTYRMPKWYGKAFQVTNMAATDHTIGSTYARFARCCGLGSDKWRGRQQS